MKLRYFVMMFLISTIFIITQIPDADATTTTRSEGNYDISITMDPDPVQPGANATFCIEVTRYDGDNNADNNVDAHEDFDEIKLSIGGVVLPPLVWDAELECFTGTFPANWNLVPNPIPVRVHHSYVDVPQGQSQSPDGVWGSTNSAADLNQETWEITHINPFYFATAGPATFDFTIIYIIVIIVSIIIGIIFVLRRRRNP